MKAVEFHTKLHSPDTIEIPDPYKGLIDTEQDVRVIVLMDEKPHDDNSWKQVTTKHFFEGYTDEDSEYDKL